MKTKLFGIFLGVNGSVLLAEMTQATRDNEICKMVHSRKTETFYSKKRFDNSELACVANAYPMRIPGYRNDLASHICGGDVYGNVVILNVNNDGFRCLMNHQKARKILEEIHDAYLFD